MKRGRYNRSLIERLLERIEIVESGCWLFTGSLSDGYGMLAVKRHRVKVQKISYEHFVGPVPTGRILDHLCRVRHCVNPDHLEPVTFGENVRRGISFAAVHARATHCPRGHEYTPENIVRQGKAQARRCRECLIIRHKYSPDYRQNAPLPQPAGQAA